MKNQDLTRAKGEQIYLNVNPLCDDLQVIHVESTLGFNLMLYAKFECAPSSDDDSVKVKKIKFYSYPMYGLLPFGIEDIIVEPEPLQKFRIIRILMAASNGQTEYEVDLNDKNIVWKYDEIVDNKVSFQVGEQKYTRKSLAASHPILEMGFPKNKLLIPVGERPCQFRLVKT